MTAVGNIRIEDYDYPLPEGRIALHPLPQRDSCRLIVSLADGGMEDTSFSRLPELMPADALMVCNETRVINARMEFFRSTGSRIEVFLLEPADPSDYVLSFACRQRCVWTCMIGNLKKWKAGEMLEKCLSVDGREVRLRAELLPLRDGERPSATRRVAFSWDDPYVTFATVVDTAGDIPIPPYLKRASEASDLDDYQTIYSRVEGSVAAPTAGLHFTPELFEQLSAGGTDIRKVTLHVGAGTFQPVKSDHIGDHPMHTERIHVDIGTIRAVADALERGKPVVAVGTTSVRTLESLPWLGVLSRTTDVSDSDAMHVPQWMAYDPRYKGEEGAKMLRELIARMEEAAIDALTASTAIMIAPGFDWRVVDTMITNFHQPQSTLLLLVGSFLEKLDRPAYPRWREIYEHALKEDYRFLSYGDACLFFRG
ncbi:MAG: S-adenosylmethionine:tRNA ribosyltransferase-isomerase [Muribaculaceae bacterium]|nr:S-adenosylmethionine:tRNA ribosyltransferase-isomerase [Muribaculaceae bacterium]